MTITPRTIRIFISSPGDVVEERDGARRVVEGLQQMYPGTRLLPVLWEELALPATASFQETIDFLVGHEPIDVAVFILWSRLGSPLGATITRPDGTPYRSGTERELDLMLAAFEQGGRKGPVILVYARNDDVAFKQRIVGSPAADWEDLIDQRRLTETFIHEKFDDAKCHYQWAYHTYREPIEFYQQLRADLHQGIDELLGVETATNIRVPTAVGTESEGKPTQSLTDPQLGRAYFTLFSDNVRYELLEDETTIGRDLDCEIVVNSRLVSKRHARVTRRPEGFLLEDLNSTNSTFLNGQLLTGLCRLREGDRIRIGDCECVFGYFALPEFSNAFGNTDFTSGSIHIDEKDTESSISRSAMRVDENVRFTVYRPKTVKPNKWYPLLAFAHLDELPADADKNDPDPIEEVKRLAKAALGSLDGDYADVIQDSRQAIPREGELTFIPEIKGCTFNPPQQSIRWVETVHKVEFRMRAQSSLDGTTVRGNISVLLGAILVADIPLRVKIDSRHLDDRDTDTEATSTKPYRKIFASYSHQDLAVVQQFEQYAELIGDRYLRDWKDLRSGEKWDERLLQMIDEADVFQLFWSRNSMRSPFVRREWEYAISLTNKDNYFVRPTYWEQPFPEDTENELPPAGLRQRHFTCLSAPQDSVPRIHEAPSDEQATSATPLPDVESSPTKASTATVGAENLAPQRSYRPKGDDLLGGGTVWRETGKFRSQRVQIDYYRHRGGLNYLKWLLVIVALLASIAYAIYVVTSRSGGRHVSTGPVALAHASFENDCGQCHASFTPISSDALRLNPEASLTHIESACSHCHRVENHYRDVMTADCKSLDQNCVLCHADHQGRDNNLVAVSETACTHCHSQLSSVCSSSHSPRVRAKVVKFTKEGHGEFSSLRHGDPGAVKFNHAQHMLPGQVNAGENGGFTIAMVEPSKRERYRMTGQADDSLVTLQCSNCHVFDGNPDHRPTLAGDLELGRYIEPINFDEHCSVCHGMNPSGRGDNTLPLPHAAPWAEISLLLEAKINGLRLSGQIGSSRDDSQIQPRPGDGFATAVPGDSLASAGSVSAAVDLVRKQCLECHDEASTSDEAIARLASATVNPLIPSRWFRFGLYDHAAHHKIDCRYCHEAAYPQDGFKAVSATDNETVMISGIESCTGCHRDASEPTPESLVSLTVMLGGQSTWASDRCTLCHRYHAGQVFPSPDHAL